MSFVVLMIPAFFMTLLVVFFILYTLYIFYIHRKYAHIPGPPLENFYLGNLNQIKEVYKKKEYRQYFFLEWAEQYGDLYRLIILHKCMLVPTSQAWIKEIMTKSKHPKCSQTYKNLSSICGARFLGNGFVTNTDHASWSSQRKVVEPAFHRKSLKKMMGTFNSVADEWIEKLRTLADGETVVSMQQLLGRVTLEALVQVAFGKRLNAIQDDNSPFNAALYKILEAMAIQIKDPFMKWRPKYKVLCGEVQEAVSFLREAGRSWIEEREARLIAGDPDLPNDILSYLVKLKASNQHLTMDDILDDLDTVIIAGQETTANILAFLFCEVGRRPDVLERLHAEVDSVIGDSTDVTFRDISHLDYVTQVWKETLRLYPPAPGSARDMVEETTVNGVTIPANSTIILSFFAIQRLSCHYENPFEFDPERFRHGVERPLFAYMPFSMGPRSCVGRQFAQIESKILLCKFLKHFTFEMEPNQSFEIHEETSLKPRGGARMTLRLRS